jgi:divinyl protochlorophyllide a 8-vinyl-reductase
MRRIPACLPRAAVSLLRRLPAILAAPLLMATSCRHAWTFIGAGQFVTLGGWRFPIVRTNAGDPVLAREDLPPRRGYFIARRA